MIKGISLAMTMWLLSNTIYPTYGQNWRPIFDLGLTAETVLYNKPLTLSEYLSKSAALDPGDECLIKMSTFYFRVNGQGIVDSIEVKGNLDNQSVKTIKSNIYATKGKWKLPPNSKPSDSCWFVFPFIDFGRSRLCNTQQNISRTQLFELVSLYSERELIFDKHNRLVIPPNQPFMISEK